MPVFVFFPPRIFYSPSTPVILHGRCHAECHLSRVTGVILFLLLSMAPKHGRRSSPAASSPPGPFRSPGPPSRTPRCCPPTPSHGSPSLCRSPRRCTRSPTPPCPPTMTCGRHRGPGRRSRPLPTRGRRTRPRGLASRTSRSSSPTGRRRWTQRYATCAVFRCPKFGPKFGPSLAPVCVLKALLSQFISDDFLQNISSNLKPRKKCT